MALHFDASGLRADVPGTLIAARPFDLIDARTHYDMTPDAQRFLLRQRADLHGPASTVMVNWTEKLKK